MISPHLTAISFYTIDVTMLVNPQLRHVVKFIIFTTNNLSNAGLLVFQKDVKDSRGEADKV